MSKPVAIEDERVRDLAADCGVPPEWVLQAAVDRFLKMDDDDIVLAIETVCDEVGKGRWKPQGDQPEDARALAVRVRHRVQQLRGLIDQLEVLLHTEPSPHEHR